MPLETLIQDLKTPSMGEIVKQIPSALSLGFTYLTQTLVLVGLHPLSL